LDQERHGGNNLSPTSALISFPFHACFCM
jgi:hypothetical protein